MTSATHRGRQISPISGGAWGRRSNRGAWGPSIFEPMKMSCSENARTARRGYEKRSSIGSRSLSETEGRALSFTHYRGMQAVAIKGRFFLRKIQYSRHGGALPGTLLSNSRRPAQRPLWPTDSGCVDVRPKRYQLIITRPAPPRAGLLIRRNLNSWRNGRRSGHRIFVAEAIRNFERRAVDRTKSDPA